MRHFMYMRTAARIQYVTVWFLAPFAALTIAALGWEYAQKSRFGSVEWAAWVQAIGSIAAIIGAIIVGNRSSKQTRQLERDRMELERDRRLKIINAILDHILQATNEWLEALDQKQLIQITSFDPDEFDTFRAYLQAIPPLEIPDSSIATHLFALPTQ